MTMSGMSVFENVTSHVRAGMCLAFTALQMSPDPLIRERLKSDVKHNVTDGLKSDVKHNVKEDAIFQDVKQNVKEETIFQDIKQVKEDTKFQVDSENIVPRYTRKDVSEHCHHGSCWIIINNKVYDVTRFLNEHPGGEDIILEYAGIDATTVFIDKGHSGMAHGMLKDFFIGEVTKDDWIPEVNMT